MIVWAHILRAWAMLWVVIGHAFLCADIPTNPEYVQVLFRIAYSFHMPLFILLSGYLLQETRPDPGSFSWQEYGRLLKDKLIRLGIPFLVFTILAMFVKTAFPGDMARSSEISFAEIGRAILYPASGPLNEMWFVVVLFWCFLAAPLWRFLLRNPWLSVLGLGGLVLLNLADSQITLFCVGRFLHFAVYFFLGMLLARYGVVCQVRIHSIIALLIGLSVYALGRYFDVSLLLAMGGILTSLVLALWAERWISFLFRSFRDETYQIFLMGIFVQIAVKMLYRRIPDCPYLPMFLLCILAGIYVPVVITRLIRRSGWPPLLYAVGLKPKR